MVCYGPEMPEVLEGVLIIEGVNSYHFCRPFQEYYNQIIYIIDWNFVSLDESFAPIEKVVFDELYAWYDENRHKS